MALSSRIPALREDYKTGRLCGALFPATVGKLFPPQRRSLVPFVADCRAGNGGRASGAGAIMIRMWREVTAPQANDTTFHDDDLGVSWRFIDNTLAIFDFPPFTGDERATVFSACLWRRVENHRAGDRGGSLSSRAGAGGAFPSLYAARWDCTHCD